jgi:hypothetical protein
LTGSRSMLCRPLGTRLPFRWTAISALSFRSTTHTWIGSGPVTPASAELGHSTATSPRTLVHSKSFLLGFARGTSISTTIWRGSLSWLEPGPERLH